MSGEVSYRTHILIGVRPNGVMTVSRIGRTCLDRTKSKRKSTGPETAMRHSRSARRPQSCRRTETAVREDEDGIGPLDQAGGEEGLRPQSKATVVPLWSLSLFRGQFPPLSEKKYSSRCPSAFLRLSRASFSAASFQREGTLALLACCAAPSPARAQCGRRPRAGPEMSVAPTPPGIRASDWGAHDCVRRRMRRP